VIVYAVGFLLLILSAFALIIGLLGSISLTETFYSVILFDGVSFILISIYYTFSPKAEKWVSAKFYFVLLALIFIYLLVRTHSRFNAISKGIADKVVEVKYDGKLISTTDTLIYIGSTRNYHFFYNTKNRQNTIIPATVVTEFKSTEIRSLNK